MGTWQRSFLYIYIYYIGWRLRVPGKPITFYLYGYGKCCFYTGSPGEPTALSLYMYTHTLILKGPQNQVPKGPLIWPKDLEGPPNLPMDLWGSLCFMLDATRIKSQCVWKWMLIYMGVQIEPGIPLQIMQSTRAEHWSTYFPRTSQLGCRPNRLNVPDLPSTYAGKFISITGTNQSKFDLCGYFHKRKPLLVYFGVLECPALSAKVLGERIWAWISVKRISHSMKGPLIVWKDREFLGHDFDMYKMFRFAHFFGWWRGYEEFKMCFDAPSPSVYESRMIVFENLKLKLCAKQNRARKTARWAVFLNVTAPNQP